MLIRTNDPRGNQAFQNQFNRLLSEAFGTLSRTDEGVSASWAPPVDISETADRLAFSIEVPGFKDEELKLRVENGVLTVEGERSFEKESKDKTWHRVERSYGKFLRSFSLPSNADTAKVEAKLEDGVLHIELPRREEAKPKSIPITVNKAIPATANK